jgi:hypothetical protein
MRPGIFRWWRLFSLDIVSGSVAGTFMASKFYSVSLPLTWWILLPLSVWIIYTFDHWMDGFNSAGTITDPRYQYYSFNRRALFILLLIQISGWLITSILFFNPTVFIYGIILAIPLAGYFYFYLNKKGRGFFYKEPGISAIYTAGVIGFPFFTSLQHGWINWAFLILYFFLTLANVLIFSYFSEEHDSRAGNLTFATVYGIKKTRTFGLLVLIIEISVSVCLFSFQIARIPQGYFILLTGMGLQLGSLLLFPAFFKRSELFGIIADHTFLVPFLCFFF